MTKSNTGRNVRATLTILAWSLAFVSTAMAGREVRRFLLSDSRFVLDETGIAIEGAQFASRAHIMRTFAPDFGRSALQVPLPERRRRLLAIDWVANTSIVRIWPNQLIVRIQERKPVAFVKLPVGGLKPFRPWLIDADGVLLSPPPVRFHFPVLSGVSEQQSEAERRGRVAAMLGLMTELGPLAKDISEVNAASVQNLRVTASVDGRAVELWMGDRDFRSRYENFANHYEEIRKHSERVTAFDLRLDQRIITK